MDPQILLRVIWGKGLKKIKTGPKFCGQSHHNHMKIWVRGVSDYARGDQGHQNTAPRPCLKMETVCPSDR